MVAPFTFGRIALPTDFTNREEIVAHLQQNMEHSVNTILISPRRWGKSSLVNFVSGKMQKNKSNVRFCIIDLYNIRSLQEFYELYAREIILATSSKWEEQLTNAKALFKSILPRFSFRPGANQEFSVNLDGAELERNVDEILDLPETVYKLKGIKLKMCIDEFQNVSYFEQPLAFQKKLRSHFQKHPNTTYCLYGSKRHLLMDFFSSPSMPFYKFGDILFLEKIALPYWKKFIPKRFQDTGKKISPALAAEIATTMENHPYFVQQFAQAVWFRTDGECIAPLLETALEQLLDHHTILFQRETDQLTNLQVNYLEALCDDPATLSRGSTIRKFNLKSTSHVARITKSLEKKEIIDTVGPEIIFIDPLFKIWLKKRYFKR